MRLTRLLDKIRSIGVYLYTCSIDNLQDHCVTYATNQDYLDRVMESGKDVVVLVPKNEVYTIGPVKPGSPESKLIQLSDPSYVFILIHNYLNMYESPNHNRIASTARIHSTAVIGADGMKYIKCNDCYGLISMKHMGNVYIGPYAEVGPCSSIARATLDSTVISDHVRIGCGVHIGHNCKIGQRTIIVDGAVVGGSVKIGSDCWLGLNCTVRNGISICSNSFVSMGALVSKDIIEPGMYVGSPARRMGNWDGSW